MHQFLTRKLMVRISSWCVCSAFFQGNVMWSVHTLLPDAYAQCTHQFLTRMLSVHISSWRTFSAWASVPDAHAQCTHQFLTRMLRVYKMNILKIWKLMRMLSMRIRNCCVCSGCASAPDTHAQHAHKGQSMRIRNSIFLIILKVPKTSKILKKSLFTVTNGLKSYLKKKIVCPN